MPEAAPREYVTGSVSANADLGGGCRLLALALPTQGALGHVEPGQFVMLRGAWDEHPILPRAFSVLDAGAGRLEILVKVVGRGTRRLGALAPGAEVSVLGPLGRPFPATEAGAVDLLLGGGSGIPPLWLQAKRAVGAGLGGQVEVIYGGRSGPDLPLLERLRGLGVACFPCTEDGSAGAPGRVTDLLTERLAARGNAVRILACGPLGMLRAVRAIALERGLPCWLSLETEMACGMGICRGCMVPRAGAPGYLCTCLEGPVVRAEEVEP